jgi:transcription elongation factor Elf1
MKSKYTRTDTERSKFNCRFLHHFVCTVTTLANGMIVATEQCKFCSLCYEFRVKPYAVD